MRRSDVLLKVHQKNNTERRETKEVPGYASIIESQIKKIEEEIINYEQLIERNKLKIAELKKQLKKAEELNL